MKRLPGLYSSLAPWIGRPSINRLELEKFNVFSLETRDLLRKDYREQQATRRSGVCDLSGALDLSGLFEAYPGQDRPDNLKD